jgi:hypothetical protein
MGDSLEYKPRRLLDEDRPWYYLESDKDYVNNNFELVVALLDNHGKKVQKKSG